MDYDIILPILMKYKNNPSHDLIKEICNVEGTYKPKGFIRCERIFYVDEYDKINHKIFTIKYGGFSWVSEDNAMKSSRVTIAKYTGMPELKVVLHYHFDNVITKIFIQNNCRTDNCKNIIN